MAFCETPPGSLGCLRLHNPLFDSADDEQRYDWVDDYNSDIRNFLRDNPELRKINYMFVVTRHNLLKYDPADVISTSLVVEELDFKFTPSSWKTAVAYAFNIVDVIQIWSFIEEVKYSSPKMMTHGPFTEVNWYKRHGLTIAVLEIGL